MLQLVSARLQGLAHARDLLARFGGDEFVVLLQGVPERELGAVTERYRAALAEPFVIEGVRLAGAGSLGAAAYPEHGITVDELLCRADAAMYREKLARPEMSELHPASTPSASLLA